MGTYDSLVESVQAVAGVSVDEARRYVDLLRDHGVLKYHVTGSGCSLTHGTFMDRDTILHVLANN